MNRVEDCSVILRYSLILVLARVLIRFSLNFPFASSLAAISVGFRSFDVCIRLLNLQYISTTCYRCSLNADILQGVLVVISCPPMRRFSAGRWSVLSYSIGIMLSTLHLCRIKAEYKSIV